MRSQPLPQLEPETPFSRTRAHRIQILSKIRTSIELNARVKPNSRVSAPSTAPAEAGFQWSEERYWICKTKWYQEKKKAMDAKLDKPQEGYRPTDEELEAMIE